MSGYSEQSQQLAEELVAKAKRNLERSGRTVERQGPTGRYIVREKAAVGRTAQPRNS
ncbi:hypothetical protein QNO21_10140 [Microbacterium sp. zg-Y818]|uniref:hypothetical protein n=1 Tax=unclassified Microbacterium TaxID=2609290 RepID=UPI00214C689E|nr:MULTISPECIES: hypothetical protein [unclassified Microbacterium]MCR2799485.1 hypothetical protein [Microbacterium sp. zg.Y818]WIM21482.1 hypothetical protein QNO21_10140 [Microbacterium sp. zg-Y818]